MSLESKIEELTGKIDELIAAMASGSETKSTGTKSTGTKAAKDKGPTTETLSEMATKLLRGETDVDGNAAKAMLKAFIAHFGCKPSETPDEQLEEAHAALKKMMDGENPFEDGDGDEDII